MPEFKIIFPNGTYTLIESNTLEEATQYFDDYSKAFKVVRGKKGNHKTDMTKFKTPYEAGKWNSTKIM